MTEPEVQELIRANHEFYAAFENRNLGAMETLWSAKSMVKCVHPGQPILQGRDPVMTSWRQIFERNPPMQFALHNIEVEIFEDMGIVTVLEDIQIEHYGRSLIQATNIFQREKGKWRLVLHHASPLLGQESEETGRVLH